MPDLDAPRIRILGGPLGEVLRPLLRVEPHLIVCRTGLQPFREIHFATSGHMTNSALPHEAQIHEEDLARLRAAPAPRARGLRTYSAADVYQLDDVIEHPTFGRGRVYKVERSRVRVQFGAPHGCMALPHGKLA